MPGYLLSPPLERVEYTHPCSNGNSLSVWVPGNGDILASSRNHAQTVLYPVVPEPYRHVNAAGCKYVAVRGVPCDGGHGRGVALQLGRHADFGLVGVPYAHQFVGECTGDSVPRRIPVHVPDGDGGISGSVVVGACFEGGKVVGS